MILNGLCPSLYLCEHWTSFHSSQVYIKLYHLSLWTISLNFLHFSFLFFFFLLFAQSGWELGPDTWAFCWFPPESALSDLQFSLSCCFYSGTSAKKFFSSLSPSSHLPRGNRMEQIRESIQCNHDKWVPAVSKDFCACVCGTWVLGNHKWINQLLSHQQTL